MHKLIETECAYKKGTPYRILEIGSWAGGSAITWAEALKQFNAGRGEVFCVDAWENYFEVKASTSHIQRKMNQALSKNMIFPLFSHNIRAAGHQDIVFSVKGPSDRVLPALRREGFNLVFVDGNHSYRMVKTDLKNSVDLVVDGGILCGDDLELQSFEIDMEHAQKHRDADFIMDPRRQIWFHPGVTLAVGELFGDVSMWEGFWAMRRRGRGWERIDIRGLGSGKDVLAVPKHLRPQP